MRENAGMTLRAAVCTLLAAVFAVAGVLHFTHTDAFATIVPPPLPGRFIVRLTGAMELLFAAGIVWPRTRPVAGILLALYCLAVLPANIFMALNAIPFGTVTVPPAVLWLRVALQFPLIALIVWATSAPRAPSHAG
ncbi:MAG: hypothetical protein AAGD34_03055 [Pseudomonadota bacterium]